MAVQSSCKNCENVSRKNWFRENCSQFPVHQVQQAKTTVFYIQESCSKSHLDEGQNFTFFEDVVHGAVVVYRLIQRGISVI